MNRPSLASLFRWAIALAGAVAVLWALGHYSHQYVVPFAKWVRGLGVWGPVAFIATYTVAEVLLLPASVLTLAAGALFGFFHGAVFSFTGAMLGSIAAFLMGRYAVGPFVRHRLHRDARFRAIDGAAARGGAKLVALLRLSPVLPYTIINYALGVTSISLRDYLAGTLAMIPGTLVYTYYGTAIASLTGLAGGARHGMAFYILLVLGVLATIAAAVTITRLARRHLGDLEHA